VTAGWRRGWMEVGTALGGMGRTLFGRFLPIPTNHTIQECCIRGCVHTGVRDFLGSPFANMGPIHNTNPPGIRQTPACEKARGCRDALESMNLETRMCSAESRISKYEATPGRECTSHNRKRIKRINPTTTGPPPNAFSPYMTKIVLCNCFCGKLFDTFVVLHTIHLSHYVALALGKPTCDQPQVAP